MCFIFNRNFPEFNILSLTETNKDLLKSILLCDSLCFHSFSQAKHISNAVKSYFNANYKIRFNGEIYIEYTKREIPNLIKSVQAKAESIKNIYNNIYDKIKLNEVNNEIINLLSTLVT